MAGNKLFVDTNILIYANTISSPFCEVSRNKLKVALQTYDSVWISQQVIREYLVVISRLMQSAGKIDYEGLARDVLSFQKSLRMIEEKDQIISRLLPLIEQTTTAGRQIHDANIVASMLSNDIQVILTNNVSDFKRFEPWIDIEPLQ